MADRHTARPRLSVAMIVRNGEQTLPLTLDSVQDIADEIVVCDTGSSDATVAVAAPLATKVLEYPWNDDFAAARNACREHVGGDWILWLDAGESLADADAAGLREFIDSDPGRSQAFLLPIKVPASESCVPAEQVAHVRLVPNLPYVFFTGRVRESLHESLADAEMPVEGLECDIHRSLREHDPQIRVLKARRNLRLCDLAIGDQGRQPRWLNCQAEAYGQVGHGTESVRLYREATKIAARGGTDMLEAYYGLLTALDGVADDVTAQISVCLEALEVFPLDAQLLCAMGGYLEQQGRTDLAMQSYATAYNSGQVEPQVWHLQEIGPFVAVCYSRMLQACGRTADAWQVLADTAQRYGDSVLLSRQRLAAEADHSYAATIAVGSHRGAAQPPRSHLPQFLANAPTAGPCCLGTPDPQA